MKSAFTLLLMGLLACSSFAGNPPDSAVTYRQYNGNWEAQDRTFYTYDSQGNKQEELVYMISPSTIREKTSYAPDGLMLGFTREQWDGSNWEPIQKTSYFFNADRVNTGYLEEVYSGGVADTSACGIYTIQYDGSNRGIEYVASEWVKNTRQFENETRMVMNSFNPDNSPSDVIVFEWNGNSWDSVMKISSLKFEHYTGKDYFPYFYGEGETMSEAEAEEYDAGIWSKAFKMASVFNANGKIAERYEFEWNSSWDTTYLYRWTYDARGNRTEQLEYNWSSPGNHTLAWGTRDSFIYTPDARIIDHYNRYYDQTTGTWEFNSWTHYYLDGATGIQPRPIVKASIYPNPAGSSIQVLGAAGSQLRILDMQGKELYNTVLQDINRLDMTSFSEGLLLFEFHTAHGETYTEKVIHR